MNNCVEPHTSPCSTLYVFLSSILILLIGRAFTDRQDLCGSLVPLFHDRNEKVRLRAAGAYLHLALSSQDGALPFDAVDLDR